MSTYGSNTDAITPSEAIVAEIARTNAAVEWLQSQIAELNPDQLVRGTKSVRRIENEDGTTRTVTEAGMSRHPLLQLYIEERRHLRDLCRDALNVKSEPSPTGGWPRAS